MDCDRLKEYIDNIEWVDIKIYKKQTHADAMNQAVAMAKGQFIIIWPEDVQFIAQGRWLEDIVTILLLNHDVGTVGLDFLRRKTYINKFSWKKWLNVKAILHELVTFKYNFRFQKRISHGIVELRTLGHLAPGVVGSGIPSLARIEVWRSMGEWKATEKRTKENIIDSSLGAETYMEKQFYANQIPWQHAILSTPVAADIVTDPIGTKAKVRGDKRFGKYFPPITGENYYEYIDYIELLKKDSTKYPLSFEENVFPIGYDLPLDSDGNLLKASYINKGIVDDF